MIQNFQFPLSNFPQTFQIAMAGVNYQMTVKWNNSEDAGWEFDLANSDTNTPVVGSVPMITGADCLAGLEYLGIGGKILVLTNGDPNAVPTFTNLGTDSNLYFVVES